MCGECEDNNSTKLDEGWKVAAAQTVSMHSIHTEALELLYCDKYSVGKSTHRRSAQNREGYSNRRTIQYSSWSYEQRENLNSHQIMRNIKGGFVWNRRTRVHISNINNANDLHIQCSMLIFWCVFICHLCMYMYFFLLVGSVWACVWYVG